MAGGSPVWLDDLEARIGRVPTPDEAAAARPSGMSERTARWMAENRAARIVSSADVPPAVKIEV